MKFATYSIYRYYFCLANLTHYSLVNKTYAAIGPRAIQLTGLNPADPEDPKFARSPYRNALVLDITIQLIVM